MKVVSLREVCDRVDYGLTTSATASPNGPKFLRITDIESSHINWNTVPYCATSNEEAEKYRLETGDVVVARTGASTGRSQWVEVDEPAVFASYLVRLRAGSRINSRYLGYVLSSQPWRNYVSSVAHGKSAQPNMSASAMADFQFALPELSHQRAIAEVLGALDDKIAANDRIASTTDELCGTETAKAIKEHGASRPLQEVLSLKYGKSLPASRRNPGPVLVYGSGGLSGYHSEPLVNRPGVVLGRKGTVGATYWADGPHFPIDTTYYVEPTQEGTDEALYYVLKTMSLRELNSDSAVPGLNRDEAYRQQVRIPDDDALVKLSCAMKDRFALMKSARAESDALAKTRDELLPLLMSGKIRVRDAERTVEEVA